MSKASCKCFSASVLRQADVVDDDAVSREFTLETQHPAAEPKFLSRKVFHFERVSVRKFVIAPGRHVASCVRAFYMSIGPAAASWPACCIYFVNPRPQTSDPLTESPRSTNGQPSSPTACVAATASSSSAVEVRQVFKRFSGLLMQARRPKPRRFDKRSVAPLRRCISARGVRRIPGPAASRFHGA